MEKCPKCGNEVVSLLKMVHPMTKEVVLRCRECAKKIH